MVSDTSVVLRNNGTKYSNHRVNNTEAMRHES